MKFRYFLIIQLITGFSCYYIATKRIDEAYLEGVQDGITVAKKYVLDKDKVCPGWLFQSNLKEAKAKICGKKNAG